MSCQVIYALALPPFQQLQVFSKNLFLASCKLKTIRDRARAKSQEMYRANFASSPSS